MNTKSPLQIGFNARLFPTNWRPVRDEMAVARAYGFDALQIRQDDSFINESHLGESFLDISRSLRKNTLTIVVELVMHVNELGLTPKGETPAELLDSNLPAIQALNCQYVILHLVPRAVYDLPTITALEDRLVPQLAAGAATARNYGFLLGFEHNEPEVPLFSNPERCQMVLDRVPDLNFVWDINHTTPEHYLQFCSLIPRMSAVHISDTPLPEVNHHLPLGQGKIDLEAHITALLKGGFTGPVILEIGGLPKSGGTGKDTDEALYDSLQRLKKAVENSIVALQASAAEEEPKKIKLRRSRSKW
jgi:sugar phosphate isomerase/epimerase